MCSRQIPSEIRSGIEVVITGLTRNQFVSNHTWVRIPPAAPAKKFPPALRFRLCRKLRYGGNFFAFGHDSLRWIRGRGETGGAGWGPYLFCQRKTVKKFPPAFRFRLCRKLHAGGNFLLPAAARFAGLAAGAALGAAFLCFAGVRNGLFFGAGPQKCSALSAPGRPRSVL